MAPYITEKQSSRVMTYNSKSASTTRTYHAFDYQDSSDALLAATNFVPDMIQVGTWLTVLPEYTVTPVFSDPDKTFYSIEVVWNTPDQASGGSGDEEADEPKEPEDPTSFSFQFASIEDTKVSTTDCTTYSSAMLGGQKGKMNGINKLSNESEPQGVSYNRPIITITAKTVVHKNVATNTWFKDRFAQVWTLNDSVWRDLPAKSVAFTGLSGSIRSDRHWDITYSFEHRPDTVGETFKFHSKKYGNSVQTIPAQDGWDYLWAQHSTIEVTNSVDSDQDVTTRELNAVHVVHDLYKTSNFSDLGMVGKF